MSFSRKQTAQFAAAVGAAAVLAVGCSGGEKGTATPKPTPVPGATIVEVTTRSFRFDPTEIRVKRDTPIEIRVKTIDIDHTFTISGLKVNLHAESPAKPGIGTFTFTQSGDFNYVCTIPGHTSMIGKLIVE